MTTQTQESGLSQKARRLRARLVRMSHEGQAPHLGSALSCIDILLAAYHGVLRVDPQRPDDPDRDRLILSKGHAAAAHYAVLAESGFFQQELLTRYNRDGSNLPEQPSPGCVPGLEAATGSLGHGLSIGLGMAMAARIANGSSRVFVVMSDGECNEGAVWEAALFAPAHQLDNVCAIIDYNGWQATGRSDEIMALSPLCEKWEAFRWNVTEVDGHNVPLLIEALSLVPDGSGRPRAVIAHTTKGKGISFMEDDNNWHYRIPNSEELRAALAELDQA